jgi:hypothetical protein
MDAQKSNLLWIEGKFHYEDDPSAGEGDFPDGFGPLRAL